jgi:hypothetical protein
MVVLRQAPKSDQNRRSFMKKKAHIALAGMLAIKI